MNDARPRVGVVIELALGHATHSANLQRLLPGTEIDPVFATIEYERNGWTTRLPGEGNWTIRSGIRARRAIRRLRRAEGIEALFIHTQVPAMLSPDHVRRLPSVISLDATPLQYDSLGQFYDHRPGSRAVESAKKLVHRLGLSGATALVTWSQWTKAGLVDDYGIDADRVTVIPPGVDLGRWTAPSRPDGDDDGPVTVLFVGGNLERKGGLVLLDAVETLRSGGLDIEVDLVTKDDVAPRPGVRVHHGLTPNDQRLVDLYQSAEVFCLPTLGDCLPMVLSEAGAVGLPLVSTAVGAIPEIVRDESGLTVPPGDAPALADALGQLVREPDLRRSLGAGARRLVEAEFDAAVNARRLAGVLAGVARA